MRRAASPDARANHTMSRMSRLLARTAAVLAVAVAVVSGAIGWWIHEPLLLPTSPFAFDVKPGASLRAVARELAGAGVLSIGFPLVALARIRAVDRSIKAGNYEIAAGITLPQLLDKLTQGDVTQTALTIIEGSTYAELAAALKSTPAIAKTVLDVTEADLARRLGLPGTSVEGWFFPDTYFYAAGSPDLALLVRAHRLMQQRLGAAWEHRAADTPLKDPYAALILASIVEKETGRAADRPLIASVFVNRLRIGMPLRSIHGDLRTWREIRRQPAPTRPEEDTAYNASPVVDCPPTPIALPGRRGLRRGGQSAADSLPLLRRTWRWHQRIFGDLPDHDRAVARFQLGVTEHGLGALARLPVDLRSTSPMTSRTGRFITLEGIDGAGREHSCGLARARIAACGHVVVVTRETSSNAGTDARRKAARTSSARADDPQDG